MSRTLHTRSYGRAGPLVAVLHGGPGAPGTMAPVARALAKRFRVLEPWQRQSGGPPLTVALHVQDLHEVFTSRGVTSRPVLVGHSWGAMLALAYAAAYPDDTGPLVLIGCGTFDVVARAELRRTRNERMDAAARRRFAQFLEGAGTCDQDPAEIYELIRAVDSFDSLPAPDEQDTVEHFDLRGNEETWQDMLRCQQQGVYPQSFRAIRSPVLMMHGIHDPHPGRMIRDSLRPHLPQLEYHEWARCGHEPWSERAVREDFFDLLASWLLQNTELLERDES